MAKIDLYIQSGDNPSAITLTTLKRSDTGATIASGEAFTEESSRRWVYDFTPVSGVALYAWVASMTYGSDAVAIQGTVSIQGESSDLAGAYWNWEGIQNILGTVNAEIVSQLDNVTSDADLARVTADGAIADAFVNWWAGQNNYVTPIADTSSNFDYLRYGANLYTAGLLIAHREWLEIPNEQRDEYRNVLIQRAEEVFTNLFGPKPTGTDAEQLPTEDTTPAAGRFQFIPINRGTTSTCDENAACGRWR